MSSRIKGLDESITQEPQFKPTLITQDNYAEFFGDDYRINELKCAWSDAAIGYIDYEDANDQLRLAFNEFYQLDEDGKVLVFNVAYEIALELEDIAERKLDSERRALKESGDL